ncbi:hypothetical protein C8Q77DRAFT_552015 [Trametes polyzona]|nr:hypothetical protein C8Q77DRAFT_552015 [Trametes polyzona]
MRPTSKRHRQTRPAIRRCELSYQCPCLIAIDTVNPDKSGGRSTLARPIAPSTTICHGRGPSGRLLRTSVDFLGIRRPSRWRGARRGMPRSAHRRCSPRRRRVLALRSAGSHVLEVCVAKFRASGRTGGPPSLRWGASSVREEKAAVRLHAVAALLASRSLYAPHLALDRFCRSWHVLKLNARASWHTSVSMETVVYQRCCGVCMLGLI